MKLKKARKAIVDVLRFEDLTILGIQQAIQCGRRRLRRRWIFRSYDHGWRKPEKSLTIRKVLWELATAGRLFQTDKFNVYDRKYSLRSG